MWNLLKPLLIALGKDALIALLNWLIDLLNKKDKTVKRYIYKEPRNE